MREARASPPPTALPPTLGRYNRTRSLRQVRLRVDLNLLVDRA